MLPKISSVEGAGRGCGDVVGNLLQRLHYKFHLSCVPEEAICQNTHRTGALGKGLIKSLGGLWDLIPGSGPASVTANSYMEVKFSANKDLSWHQRQTSYNVFAHMNLVLDAKTPTELDVKVSVLRRGCSLWKHFENMSRNPKPRSKHTADWTNSHREEGEQNWEYSTKLSRAHHADCWGVMNWITSPQPSSSSGRWETL